MPLLCGQASFEGRLTPSEVWEVAAAGFYPAIYPPCCFIYLPGRMDCSQAGGSAFALEEQKDAGDRDGRTEDRPR